MTTNTAKYSINNGILSPADWCPSPNYNTRPDSPTGDISLLVLHNISLPPEQFGGGYVQQFFANQLNPNEHPYFSEIADLKVSSHLFIERCGKVVQFVNLNDRAWHAGRSTYQGQEECNDYSIGIELEGTDSIQYTDAQYQTLSELIPAILSAYPQITPYRITGHEFIAPGRKTDPGNAFNWQMLFQGLNKRSSKA